MASLLDWESIRDVPRIRRQTADSEYIGVFSIQGFRDRAEELLARKGSVQGRDRIVLVLSDDRRRGRVRERVRAKSIGARYRR